MNSSEVGWFKPSATTLKVPSLFTFTRLPVLGTAGERADVCDDGEAVSGPSTR